MTSDASPRTRARLAALALRMSIGLGALAALPVSGAAQDTTSRATPAGVLVDFQDVELRTVISALAEAARLNVSYGDLPSRRITLRLRQPLPRSEIPALLRSIALTNGLRVIEEGTLMRFDSPSAGTPTLVAEGERRLFVHRLRHARAARLAATLQSIFGGEGAGLPAAAGLGTVPLSTQLRRQVVPPLALDTLPAVASRLRPAPGTTGSIAAALTGDVQIVPDETTNSLLIRAQPADYEVIRQAVEALDLRPLQVVIEVLIAEVRRTRDVDLGVTAGVLNADGSRSATIGALDTTNAGGFTLQLHGGGNISFDVAIRALAQRGDVRILSRPVIVAQNNQEARILVGSQRPFVQVFRSLPTEAAVRDQVVQYRDVGTSLTILPTINPDGYVNLLLSQEVSSATAESQFGAPVISTREASTHLFVRNRQTAVIGGLVDRQTEDVRNHVPKLGSIPLIGWLFRGKREVDLTSELFLFLTPHIVEADQDVDRVREQIEARPPMKEEIPKSPPVVKKP